MTIIGGVPIKPENMSDFEKALLRAAKTSPATVQEMVALVNEIETGDVVKLGDYRGPPIIIEAKLKFLHFTQLQRTLFFAAIRELKFVLEHILARFGLADRSNTGPEMNQAVFIENFYTATGGVIVAGSLNPPEFSGGAHLRLDGDALADLSGFFHAATGGLIIAGEVDAVTPVVGNGGVVLGGIAVLAATWNYEATGGIVVNTGAGAGTIISRVATGGMVLGGAVDRGCRSAAEAHQREA